MLHTILVPLDGSILSERALPYAERLARDSGAELLLMRAAATHTWWPADAPAQQIRAVSDAEHYLEQVSGRLTPGTQVRTAVFYGDPADAIVEKHTLWHADLVVMSTHGRTGPGRALMGSVADQVLRRIDMPVLLIPRQCHHGWPYGRGLRVMVGLDGSPESGRVLETVRDLMPALGGLSGRVYLVRVVERPALPVLEGPISPEVFDAAMQTAAAQTAEARRSLEKAAASTPWPEACTLLTPVGAPARTMVSLARDHYADVIALATHGRGGLSRLVFGSVASAVVHESTVPLLIVRAPGAALPAGPEAPAEPVGEGHRERAGV